MLTQKEISRYSRHLLLREIGRKGQEKLKNARVLVIGAGGLGCPVLLYLAAAGVGEIGIVDDDVVDETNLQRQILFDVADLGKSKAESAKAKLQKQNPLIAIDAFNTKLTVENTLHIFHEYDIVVDGTDNFATRYLVNDACWLSNKILVSGSLFRFQGQLSVFNLPVGEGPTYRCLFPSPPSPEQSPNCTATGVIGTLPGIIGTMMANEVIKIITGSGEVLSGKLLVADMLTMNFQTIEFEKSPKSVKAIPANEDEFRKMNYGLFCNSNMENNSIKEITATELLDLITANEEIRILDVREPDEQPIVPEFNDLKIALGDLEEETSQIPHGKKVIVVCKSGMRSRRAIEILQNKYGYKNLFNLSGGVMEWLPCANQTNNV